MHLPVEDAYLEAVYVVCIQLSQGKLSKEARGSRGYSPQSNHKAESLSHCASKSHRQWFLLLASGILPCLLYNHTAYLDVQHRSAILCIGNATAWTYDLTVYAAPCFCLPQHVQTITPLARKMWSNGYLYQQLKKQSCETLLWLT